jgi:anaerobic dimethyl sulfoxide reductase subunit A
MSQGGWYTPDKDGIDRRGSINVLTSSAYPTPLAKGNPQHTNLVEVAKA